VSQNLGALAGATGKDVAELVVIVLDKPRHKNLIAEITAVGASVQLVSEGDVAGAVSAASGVVDLVLGIGGTPEGILAACAVRALGGFMQARLAPQTAGEAERVRAVGHDLERVLDLDDLVRSDDVVFVLSEV
jgi:fructose-1,6-bisphosphatase II